MIIDTHVHLPPDCDNSMQQQILLEAAKNGINLLIASDLGNWKDYPEKGIIYQANIRAKKFAELAFKFQVQLESKPGAASNLSSSLGNFTPSEVIPVS